MPGVAGYMMMAGHFRQNLESSGDLNRPRSPEGRSPRRVFAVLFARRKKYQSVSLMESSEVFQTSIQLAAMAASHEQN